MHTCKSAAVPLFVVLSLIVGSGSDSRAQEVRIKPKDLPRAVVRAFHKAYPGAKITGATREIENRVTVYELESLDGSITRDVVFTADGRLSEVEEAMPYDALPDIVRASFLKAYPDAGVKKVERLSHGGSLRFEITVTMHGSQKEIVIDSSGTIVKGPPPEQNGRENEDDDDDN